MKQLGLITALLMMFVALLGATDDPTAAAGGIAPFPAAPLCDDVGEAHDVNRFHTLWDAERGCHYDHEHGQNPFTPEVGAAFPAFDLFMLLGSVEVGHTNPSSPMENHHKHGGFKWDVTLSHSAGCFSGQIPTGVDALAIQYHAFGDYAIEFESRVHSVAGLIRQCRSGNPTDYGYAYFVQHADYGQRVTPYQGAIIPYPDTPQPAYKSGIAPYLTVDCVANLPQCRASLERVRQRNENAASTWAGRPQAAPLGSTLFSVLFRVRDNYQLLDISDTEHPFTFRWICSSDGGATFDPAIGANGGRCRWNNTTTRIHEVAGEIPAAWDNTPMDSDPRAGRITAEGYVTRFGALNPSCTAPGGDCFPFKLVSAFTGRYATSFLLDATKGSFARENLPERDIYFCNGVPCPEPLFGEGASGWPGAQN